MMKNLIFTLLAVHLLSQGMAAPRLFVDKICAPEDIRVERDIEYLSIEAPAWWKGRLMDQQGISNTQVEEWMDELSTSRLHLDAYFPPMEQGPARPVIIFFHGGGFVTGSKRDASIRLLCETFAQKGYVTLSVQYRLWQPSCPSLLQTGYQAAQDGKAAVRFVKSMARDWHIDPSFVFVGGISAGGVTALNVAYLDDDDPLPGRFLDFDDKFGCLDCAGLLSEKYTSKVAGAINLAGGIYHPDMIDEWVPLYQAHGTEDKVVVPGKGVPFQPFMLYYNKAVEKATGWFNQLKTAFFGRQTSQMDPSRYQMPPVYGSFEIQKVLKKKNIPHRTDTFRGYDHNLILSQSGVPRKAFRLIEANITAFLLKEMSFVGPRLPEKGFYDF